MGEPVIGAQAFACLVLMIGDQKPAVPILPALEPAERTFRFIHEDTTARAVDLPLAYCAQLVLPSEGVALVAGPATFEKARFAAELTAPSMCRRLDPPHRLASPREQRIDERGDGALQMLEPSIQFRIVAPVLNHAAGMRHCRPVAGEQRADLGKAEAADDMSEVHPHLAGEGRPWRASRRGRQLADVHLEHRRHGGIDYRPEL